MDILPLNRAKIVIPFRYASIWSKYFIHMGMLKPDL